jgi:hypothetical protein
METLGFVHIGTTPFWINNQGWIKLVQNPKFHRITKHIDIQYHVIWEVTSTHWIKRYLFADALYFKVLMFPQVPIMFH